MGKVFALPVQIRNGLYGILPRFSNAAMPDYNSLRTRIAARYSGGELCSECAEGAASNASMHLAYSPFFQAL